MVVPDPNIYYKTIEYGLDNGRSWCTITYQNLTQNITDELSDEKCFYCNAPIISYNFERVMDYGIANMNEMPMNGTIKMSCWCAMWLYKAQQKQQEWKEIQPVFDEWIKEQEAPWVTSTI